MKRRSRGGSKRTDVWPKPRAIGKRTLSNSSRHVMKKEGIGIKKRQFVK